MIPAAPAAGTKIPASRIPESAEAIRKVVNRVAN
jgi:hypothetical protein